MRERRRRDVVLNHMNAETRQRLEQEAVLALALSFVVEDTLGRPAAVTRRYA